MEFTHRKLTTWAYVTFALKNMQIQLSIRKAYSSEWKPFLINKIPIVACYMYHDIFPLLLLLVITNK